MDGIPKTEMQFLLLLLKSPGQDFNANSISKGLKISPMGALNIAGNLVKQGIISSKEMGRAKFFSICFNKDYANQYLKFLLMREAEQAPSYVRMWINEVRTLKNAELAIIFGSVLEKQEKANDIDVLLVTRQNEFAGLKKEIERINAVNSKKLHPVYVDADIYSRSLKGGAILDAIKGIVAFGEDKFIKLIKRN